jgi:O-acetyl-ADP-ribose deacetylase (regulator of RNase III)
MNTILHETTLSTGQRLQLIQGDITAETTDAIVNAANEDLQHGGGLAWAILRCGGEVIQQESDEWVRTRGPVAHAAPAWTSGGALPAKYVIHAVGPVWGDGDEDAKLADAVTGSLRVATSLMLGSISIPAISTGIFGFPKDRAALIILAAISAWFAGNDSTLHLVRLVLYDAATVTAFQNAWPTSP